MPNTSNSKLVIFIVLRFPVLSFLVLSFPLLSFPVLRFPVLSFPVLRFPVLSFPVLSLFFTEFSGVLRFPCTELSGHRLIIFKQSQSHMAENTSQLSPRQKYLILIPSYSDILTLVVLNRWVGNWFRWLNNRKKVQFCESFLPFFS